ncbi:hypothetical protein [Pedobacter flavus]|uniref:Uncharacterized protein n=1 Tax=Pedobacter flavus TaxID=3113906 RepID=A0ABU7H300_9SPHI|nr:hypothetical protein [Pedobacter sp. VNH31]MEE1885695.1 hypothetical protein [Pedobacter sp. VNH31]
MLNKNNYNFKNNLEVLTDELLIARFNDEIGKNGWVTARSFFILELVSQFQCREIDYSIITMKNGISLKNRVKLKDKKLII